LNIQAADIDVVAATIAITIIPTEKFGERLVDSSEAVFHLALRGLRHALLLHRIHARQASNLGLVKHDRIGRSLTRLILGLERFPKCFEPPLKGCQLAVVQHV